MFSFSSAGGEVIGKEYCVEGSLFELGKEGTSISAQLFGDFFERGLIRLKRCSIGKVFKVEFKCCCVRIAINCFRFEGFFADGCEF